MSYRWTKADLARVTTKTVAPQKFRNTKVPFDGYVFDSKRECSRYQELRLLEKAKQGELQEVHQEFTIRVNGVFIGLYHDDFTWLDFSTGQVRYEDVKSKATKTEAYQLRKKLVEAIYGIEIVEI